MSVAFVSGASRTVVYLRAAAALAGLLAATAAGAQSATLDTVRARGEVICGVAPGFPGFAEVNDQGVWEGLDVDLCRAVAAAALGDAGKVQYTPLAYAERFTALQNGVVDLMVEVTTWTFVRDVQMGLTFAGINFYDGQGFMVRKDSGVEKVSDLDGATICVDKGTTNELNLGDHFRSNGLNYQVLVFDKSDETLNTYLAGRCDAYTIGAVGLASALVKMEPAEAAGHRILPELISKDPLGPVVREDDARWADIVGWSLIVTKAAEEFGITSANVDEVRASSSDPEIRRMLGVDGTLGEYLGLSNDWAYQIIKQVGNYGESFEKYVGPDTPLGLPRGLNALWRDGGLFYTPPFR